MMMQSEAITEQLPTECRTPDMSEICKAIFSPYFTACDHNCEGQTFIMENTAWSAE